MINLNQLSFMGTERGGHSGMQYRYLCPSCNDTKGKFMVDFGLRMGKCWKCQLVSPISGDPPTRIIIPARKTTSKLCVPHRVPLSRSTFTWLATRLGYEKDLIRARKHFDELWLMETYAPERPKFDHCLFIPLLDPITGRMKSYVCRRLPGFARIEPKYMNDPSSTGELYIPFYRRDQKVFLVEGPMDAIAIGRTHRAISLLGSEMPMAKLHRLLDIRKQIPFASLRVWLDPDKYSTSRGITEKLRSYFPDVRNVTGLVGEKYGLDPADLAKVGQLERILREEFDCGNPD